MPLDEKGRNGELASRLEDIVTLILILISCASNY
jgi:hypothetical protein